VHSLASVVGSIECDLGEVQPDADGRSKTAVSTMLGETTLDRHRGVDSI
jgi:hypothetical protein